MSLWGGLLAIINLSLQQIYIYGDSKLVVDGINGCINLVDPELQGWFQRASQLWIRLKRPPIKHIFREHNTRADGLSKKGTRAIFGNMQVQHIKDGSMVWENNIPLP